MSITSDKTAMAKGAATGDEEKTLNGGYNVGVYGAQQQPAHAVANEYPEGEFYDPSKESLLTRLGLNAESFKRAPGSTRGLVAHGDIPPEYLREWFSALIAMTRRE
jgi:hypothetical protein